MLLAVVSLCPPVVRWCPSRRCEPPQTIRQAAGFWKFPFLFALLMIQSVLAGSALGEPAKLTGDDLRQAVPGKTVLIATLLLGSRDTPTASTAGPNSRWPEEQLNAHKNEIGPWLFLLRRVPLWLVRHRMQDDLVVPVAHQRRHPDKARHKVHFDNLTRLYDAALTFARSHSALRRTAGPYKLARS
jgi:hypothetical protein